MFQGLDILRVVAIPARPGWAVRPLTIEMYEDGSILQYVAPGFRFTEVSDIQAQFAHHKTLSQFLLSDDLGTHYEQQRLGHGSSRDGSLFRGYAIFTPPVPFTATRLTVEVEGQEGGVEVELPPPL